MYDPIKELVRVDVDICRISQSTDFSTLRNEVTKLEALSSLENIRSHPAGVPTASWSMNYPNGVVSQPNGDNTLCKEELEAQGSGVRDERWLGRELVMKTQ